MKNRRTPTPDSLRLRLLLQYAPPGSDPTELTTAIYGRRAVDYLRQSMLKHRQMSTESSLRIWWLWHHELYSVNQIAYLFDTPEQNVRNRINTDYFGFETEVYRALPDPTFQRFFETCIRRIVADWEYEDQLVFPNVSPIPTGDDLIILECPTCSGHYPRSDFEVHQCRFCHEHGGPVWKTSTNAA